MQDSFRRVGTAALLGAAMCLGASQAQAVQCAIFARSVTGLELSGDAWQWWNHAGGTYARGNAPKTGAVLVFMRSGPMRHGHVSVVSRIVNNREIMVDHANWGTRGAVARNVAVIDDSPGNDWSSVRVAFGGGYGRSNATYGFIYDAAASSKEQNTAANRETAADETAGDRDEVVESTPRRHANHRWIKLAVAHGSQHGLVQQHGRGVLAHHVTIGRGGLKLASYEPASRTAKHAATEVGHGARLVTVKASPKTASHHESAPAQAHGKGATAKPAVAHHEGKARPAVVASAAQHKAHAKG